MQNMICIMERCIGLCHAGSGSSGHNRFDKITVDAVQRPWTMHFPVIFRR